MTILEMIQALRYLKGVHYTAFGRLTMNEVADALEKVARPSIAGLVDYPSVLNETVVLSTHQVNILKDMLGDSSVRFYAVPAIKQYREWTGVSLKQSVDYINSLRDALGR